MSTATLAVEASRYLEAIDLVRALELDVTWRSEADEVGALPAAEVRSEPRCRRCASPRVRINGRHVCLGAY